MSSSINGSLTEEATPDQLLELTAHLERKRADVIVEAVRVQLVGQDANDPTQFKAGYALACEEIAHRLKTEAWGFLSNGGFGPTGAANEDDRPSPEFPGLLRRALASPASAHVRVPRDAERAVLESLLVLVGAVWCVLDDGDDQGAKVIVPSSSMDGLEAAVDALEALPDDQPGYVMEPAAKARWALRGLLADQAAPPAPHCPLGCGSRGDCKALRDGCGSECVSLPFQMAPAHRAIWKPINPYAGAGSMVEAWDRGYEGQQAFAATGSDYLRAYQEGEAARAACDIRGDAA